MEGHATSHWCSFIPDSFLRDLANDNTLGPEARQSVNDTINGGHSLSFHASHAGIVDEGDHKLSRAERSERLSGLEVPSQVDTLPGISVHGGRQAIDRNRGQTVASIVRDIFTFFEFEYGYRIFEKTGNAVAVTINYGHNYLNAHWTGRRVVLGSGNPAVLDDFHQAHDVVAHEITHGIILRTSGLKIVGQPGELSEHLADVFGLLYKHHASSCAWKSAPDCVWTVGESLWASPEGFFGWSSFPNVSRQLWTASGGKIVENHSRHSPSTALDVDSSEPDHYLEYCKNDDVHHNSGADCTFAKFAAFTKAYAERDFGGLVEAVKTGWKEVGVTPKEIPGLQAMLSN
ncbi:hypothetical protein SNK03_004307 [Fusarium graminearum]|uniref:hypothetical protein n=1 Tax=Gibberella zeae (strain ATCC MYA-4620 / CBS 123657 / FGSC 9075 / NRRL 31084 / PH-1) TaxID=229533 RepID=UPI00021F164A|nr:hypothetical protein FGSG_08091 [Fusarium graminearum PH-1]ESU15304.1 hypothetical protein FGSG_08091 [Fusarium graminearum PH-1]|eukprot:XP_011320729.1 hypothetical protein FGSG_08091 [Fusarium graminearum PH-1]